VCVYVYTHTLATPHPHFPYVHPHFPYIHTHTLIHSPQHNFTHIVCVENEELQGDAKTTGNLCMYIYICIYIYIYAGVYHPIGNTLQHTATHCNTLQHTATHCNTLQHTRQNHNAGRWSNTLQQHTATLCTTLQHTAPH